MQQYDNCLDIGKKIKLKLKHKKVKSEVDFTNNILNAVDFTKLQSLPISSHNQFKDANSYDPKFSTENLSHVIKSYLMQNNAHPIMQNNKSKLNDSHTQQNKPLEKTLEADGEKLKKMNFEYFKQILRKEQKFKKKASPRINILIPQSLLLKDTNPKSITSQLFLPTTSKHPINSTSISNNVSPKQNKKQSLQFLSPVLNSSHKIKNNDKRLSNNQQQKLKTRIENQLMMQAQPIKNFKRCQTNHSIRKNSFSQSKLDQNLSNPSTKLNSLALNFDASSNLKHDVFSNDPQTVIKKQKRRSNQSSLQKNLSKDLFEEIASTTKKLKTSHLKSSSSIFALNNFKSISQKLKLAEIIGGYSNEKPIKTTNNVDDWKIDQRNIQKPQQETTDLKPQEIPGDKQQNQLQQVFSKVKCTLDHYKKENEQLKKITNKLLIENKQLKSKLYFKNIDINNNNNNDIAIEYD